MPSPLWDVAAYAAFTDQRLRPARDLINRILDIAPRRIFDLGCGSGQVTRLLAELWFGA